jgi:transcriptional regulator with XRE-family HTH domain
MPTLSNPLQGRRSADAPLAHDLAYSYRRALGDYVRDARHKAEMTQRQVAEALGVREQMISQIEVGRNNIPPEDYEKLVSVLGLDKEEFAKTLLRYTNPWLYALMFGIRDAQLRDDLNILPDRKLSGGNSQP